MRFHSAIKEIKNYCIKYFGRLFYAYGEWGRIFAYLASKRKL